LILSTDAYYKEINKLFQASFGEMDGVKGNLQMLLERQHVVDVVMEHNLEKDIHRYPLLIYPEWKTITAELKNMLVRYVKEGGNLLVVGPEACRLFQEELGVVLLDSVMVKTNHLSYEGKTGSVKSLSSRVKLGREVVPFGKIYGDKQLSSPSETAGSIRQLGKGKIAGVYLDLGARYLNGKVTVARDYMDGLVNELFPDALVTVHGSQYVDLAVNRINGKLAVNLINTAGPHDNDHVYVYDQIPPVGPLTVVIKMEEKPERLTLEPYGEEPDWEYSDGVLRVTIPGLDFYQILLVDE
jgi:hypothetical protein